MAPPLTPASKAPFEDRLARILARHFEGFRQLKSCDRLSGGASQETYRLVMETEAGENVLAMRRAPAGVGESDAGPGLAAEALLMTEARKVDVPGPDVHYVLQAADGIGAGFIMEWIEGETLGAKIARADEFFAIRPKLAYQCGQILARIHSIDIEAAGLSGKLNTLTPHAFIHQMWDNYKAFKTPQPMIDFTARWLLENLPASYDMRLVHNDYRNGNLIVSPTDGIVAVLDWEVAHIGDPMRDLGWICTNSWRFGRSEFPVGGFGAREDLFAGYEAESGMKIDPEHVRFWEVFGSFWWAVGCLRMGERYRRRPTVGVEYPAIGRRTSECQIDCANLLIPGPIKELRPEPFSLSSDMPGSVELLKSVRDFLRGDIIEGTEGRTRFLARVGSNSLDIVLRELQLGPSHMAERLRGLRELFDCKEDFEKLQWRLVGELRDGSMPLDTPGLAKYLRQSVFTQIAIDQPTYSGFLNARKWGEC
ncbi:MAG: phosphotransferase family protein [Sneathiella sp.]|nr:phosphotransferase family protein [Sneathiella sp.]